MFKTLKIGCLGIIMLFVVLIIIGIIAGSNDSTTTKKTPVSGEVETGATKDKKKEKNYKIGDSVRVGDVVFKVNKVSTTNKITAGDGFMTYKPEAEGSEFLIVSLSVKNAGKKMITTDSSYFQIIKDGAQYSPSTVIVSDDKFFLYDGINPGLTQKGNILFEIPKDLKGLKLNVQTGFWGTETEVINLK